MEPPGGSLAASFFWGRASAVFFTAEKRRDSSFNLSGMVLRRGRGEVARKDQPSLKLQLAQRKGKQAQIRNTFISRKAQK